MNSILRPFLHEGIKGLDQLIVLNAAIPDEVSAVYEEIVGLRGFRYRGLIRRYRRFEAEVEKHNAAVQPILDRLDAIDARTLLANAGSFTDEQAKDLLMLTDEARSFLVPANSPYLQKVDFLRVYATRIKTIREQWKVWNQLDLIRQEIQGFEGFIAKALASEFANRFAGIQRLASGMKNPYYDFDPTPGVLEWIKTHNEDYLDLLGNDPIFDDIGGVYLDPQQRRAAVSPVETSLVIAGAGSGKTTTICGRVKYLMARKGVPASDILLLSYSKKSADDLAAKMASIHPEITVGTFHKIGLDILREATGVKQTVEEQWDAIVEEFFRSEMGKDPDLLRLVLTHYALYLNAPNDSKKYSCEGDLFADIRDNDFLTLRDSMAALTGNLETIKKERVKSSQELALANFYFINGIDYRYERAYQVRLATPEKRQYTPDFYLPEYGIYHEHFGIDEQGRAKQFEGEAELRYLDGVAWKRMCHRAHGTKLIETTSAQFSKGTVFEDLRKTLVEAGVEFHPLDDSAVRNAIDSIYHGQSFRSFIILVKSFLSLYKSRYEDEAAFDEMASSHSKDAKTVSFLSICRAIYRFYMKRIRSEGKIDFDDMILRSTRHLSSLDGFRYKHVIVDEFQDISYSRMAFLKAILAHGGASLFAVGDDWQSIYRFAGCDVNIVFEFEKHFGESEWFFIGNVHRNSQELQDIATRFIEANPEQIRKAIHADKHLKNPIRVLYYQGNEDAIFLCALRMIHKQREDAHVLLLGRNNKDITPFLGSTAFLNSESGIVSVPEFPKMAIRYSTVHGSKGLEEDYVILLSARDSSNGFPNKTEDDPVLNLVLSSPSTFPFAEERRLWYVALTRTRSYTLILAPANEPSQFLLEMKGDYVEVNPEEAPQPSNALSCPRCKSGHLVLRQSERGKFYGCSNYPYCAYTIDDFRAVEQGFRCPLCDDFLVFRKGSRGAFYGCHNYPTCQFTKPYSNGSWSRKDSKGSWKKGYKK